ncbi:MAG: class I tRNA ligase family protein [Chloroflexia bacterium]|nr:class I tRNA ligase family protein [Chloroflexia bacterium]
MSGWEAFAGHTPHRPWIDEVKIACSACGQVVSRIPDVGNPWLDAGIVPFSTLDYRHNPEYWAEWFPADMISESFPGQFRNWFYSMIAQTTALVTSPAFVTVFSYALMRDEKGEEMHKSKGNAIWFDEAADEIGVDVMRWLFARANPDANLNFGLHITDDVRRRFILPLWNSYAFFATYAAIDRFDPTLAENQIALADRTVLDRWIISQLHLLISDVRFALDEYAPDRASWAIERFTIDELSNWYIRRNRRRFWKSENDADKAAAYQTLYECLVTLAQLLAPFLPFLADAMYQNLVRTVDHRAVPSIHLTDFPVVARGRIDATLSQDMDAVLEVVGAGHAARQEAAIKVRQPLAALFVYSREPEMIESILRLHDLVEDELNVKSIEPLADPGRYVTYTIRPNLRTLGPRLGNQLASVCESLASLDPSSVAASVEAREPIVVSSADGEVTLEPSDILVDPSKLPGFAAAHGARSTVVLDTSLTPRLIQEGMVRDFVRGIQDARKQAGYRIDDTIAVDFVADPEVVWAVDAHRQYVMTETLAFKLVAETATGASDAVEPAVVEGPGGLVFGDGWYVDQISVGSHHVRIALRTGVPVPSSQD